MTTKPKRSPRGRRNTTSPPSEGVRGILAPKDMSRTLALDGDPYVTADGRVIQPEHMFHRPEATAKTESKAKAYRPIRRRTIKELPGQPNVLKGIAVVFVYTVFGLSDREIADLLTMTTHDVRSIRSHPAYAETFDIVSSEFVNARSKLLSARIASYADAALDTVHDVMVNGTKESNKLRAGIDILDRAGVRPKDEAARAVQQQNELRIVIMKGDDTHVEVNGLTVDDST